METTTYDEIALPEIDEPTSEPAVTKSKTDASKLAGGARVTEGNARLLQLAAMFPGVDSEAMSIVSGRQASRFYAEGGLPTIKGTEKRLRKLERLGTLDRYRNPATQVCHYGITKAGIGAAWSFGYDMENAATIRELAIERMNHYRMIALVAAQFASPAGFFRESLGIEPVALEALITEQRMREVFDPIQKRLIAERKEGKPGLFSKWRENRLQSELDKRKKLVSAVTDEAARRKMIALQWSTLVEGNHELLTLGLAPHDDNPYKAVYQPDLAVMLDGTRTSARASNLLVEIELSKKSFASYSAMLATIKAEVEQPYIYSRAVFFTVGTQIPTLLKKVDAANGFGLIESGKLLILPLQHRDQTPVVIQNRVKIGGN